MPRWRGWPVERGESEPPSCAACNSGVDFRRAGDVDPPIGHHGVKFRFPIEWQTPAKSAALESPASPNRPVLTKFSYSESAEFRFGLAVNFRCHYKLQLSSLSSNAALRLRALFVGKTGMSLPLTQTRLSFRNFPSEGVRCFVQHIISPSPLPA